MPVSWALAYNQFMITVITGSTCSSSAHCLKTCADIGSSWQDVHVTGEDFIIVRTCCSDTLRKALKELQQGVSLPTSDEVDTGRVRRDCQNTLIL